MEWLYITLAGLAAVGVLSVAFGVHRGTWKDAETGERLPLTALQKRAWIALGFGLVAMIALVAVFALGGVEYYDREPLVRVLVYGLLAAGVPVHSLVLPRALRRRPPTWLDERDVRILERAPALQGVAVLVVLAGWTIGLTETYRASGSIPVVFPSLIFLSAFFVHLASLSFSVLLGYRHALGDA